MTEQEFFARRRMFAVVDSTLLLAPVGCPLGHYHWLNGIVGSVHDVLDKCVRGYVFGGCLVAYVGSFSHHVGHEDVRLALEVLRVVTPITEVGLGVLTESKRPWVPKTTYPVQQYLNRVALLKRPMADRSPLLLPPEATHGLPD